MSAERIAQRYAKSLVDHAMSTSQIDTVKEDMSTLATMFGHRELSLMLKSPIISADKKKSVLSSILHGKVSEVTSKFIDILISKGRESSLPAVVTAFDQQYNELKRRSIVKVTSAAPLDDARLAELKAKILQSGVTHPDIQIETTIDQDLIGGFVLDIADTQYDASVRGKLDKLRSTFTDDSFQKKF